MSIQKTYYVDDVEVERGSIEAHKYTARILAEAQESLDKIEYGLIDDTDLRNERPVLEAIRIAVSDLRAFHDAMAANLERYDGNAEVARLEAQSRLVAAVRALRKRRTL